MTHLGRHYRCGRHNKDESSNAMTLLLTHLEGGGASQCSVAKNKKMNPEERKYSCIKLASELGQAKCDDYEGLGGMSVEAVISWFVSIMGCFFFV